MRIYSEEPKKVPNVRAALSPTSSTCSSASSSTPSEIDPNGLYANHINRVQLPLVFNKSKPNISMHKFISSKGKQMTKENNTPFCNPYFLEGDHNHSRPLRYMSNPIFFRKRLSAIDKIQEELREMKVREDELRCQRVRNIGLSYPNLNSICDEDFTSDDQTIESSEENKDSFHSRYSSNPDLINGREIVDSSPDPDNNLKIGGPRRKIPLIALWEQRIQEISEKK